MAALRRAKTRWINAGLPWAGGGSDAQLDRAPQERPERIGGKRGGRWSELGFDELYRCGGFGQGKHGGAGRRSRGGRGRSGVIVARQGDVEASAIVVRDGGDAVGIRIVCISVATGLWVRECEVSVFRVQAQYSIDASARHLQREQKGGDKVEDGAKSGHVN